VTKITQEDWFKESKDAVEIGSGCLRNSMFLLEKGIHVAVWESPTVISRYEKVYENFRKSGGVVMNKLERAEHDFAIITFVLETICPELSRRRLLGNTRRMLKDGGRLVLGVRSFYDVKTANDTGVYCPIGRGYRTPIKTFIKPYGIRSLSRILRATRFRVEKVYTHSPILNLVAKAS